MSNQKRNVKNVITQPSQPAPPYLDVAHQAFSSQGSPELNGGRQDNSASSFSPAPNGLWPNDHYTGSNGYPLRPTGTSYYQAGHPAAQGYNAPSSGVHPPPSTTVSMSSYNADSYCSTSMGGWGDYSKWCNNGSSNQEPTQPGYSRNHVMNGMSTGPLNNAEDTYPPFRPPLRGSGPSDNGFVGSDAPPYRQSDLSTLATPPIGAEPSSLAASPQNQTASAPSPLHLATNIHPQTTASSTSPSSNPSPPSATPGGHFDVGGYRCACGKDFSGNRSDKNKKSNLSRHIAEKEGTAPQYFCRYNCGRTAPRKGNMQTHERTCSQRPQPNDSAEASPQ